MDNIISIHYNSDWEFEYPLPASYDNCPFKITLYTIDYEDNRYEAYFDGTSYVNCTKTDSNSIIVHIDNFTFYPGCVRVRVEYFIDSASFNDGIYNGIHAEKTNIYTTKAKSETTAVTFEGSSLPNFDAVNIANNVETALNDINDKSEELEEALSTLSDANEQAEALLDELNEWKETTDNLVDKDTLDEYAKLTDLNQYMTEDEVSDWLENYYTKTECNTRYYTKTQIDAMLNEINPTVDLSDYATKEDLANAITGSGNITLDDYVSKAELSSCGYLTQHQSLNDYATKNWVYSQNYITLDYLDDEDILHVDLDGYVKYEDLNLDDYATKTWVGNQGFLTQHQSLEGLASQSWVQNQHYLTQHQSLANYVTTSALNNRLNSYATNDYVENRIQEISRIDLSSYATKAWVQNQGFLTEQLWERGSGLGSIKSPTAYDASGNNAVAEGYYTLANEINSHAEGDNTKAYGISSHVEGHYTCTYGDFAHAEGVNTVASADSSHAEGWFTYSFGWDSHTEGSYTKTYNIAEHAEGHYNVTHGSQNNQWQGTGSYTISSIGIGTSEEDRKNAFEVMQNGDIYAYGVGNYDGTNPESAYTLKETVDSLSERIDNITIESIDLSSYVSKQELSTCGYLTSHQSLDDYATKAYVLEKVSGLSGNVDLSSYVSYSFLSSQSYITSNDFTSELNRYYTAREIDDKLDEISSGGVDLSNYPTYSYTNSRYVTYAYATENYPTYAYVEGRYLKTHQPLTDYATKTYVMEKINSIEISGGVDLTDYVTKTQLSNAGYITSIPSEYVTQAELSANGYLTSHQSLSDYATKTYVMDKISAIEISGGVDLSDYVTKTQLSNAGYLTSHQSLSGYATQTWVQNQNYLTQHQSLSGYATETYVMNKINGIEPVTYNVSYTGSITQTISIWQGTQAQYNALSDYTTYQLYLIAQS